MGFSDNDSFKRLIESKEDEIQKRYESIQNAKNFQRLYSLLRENGKNPTDNDFHLIMISKENIENLCENAHETILSMFSKHDYIRSNVVQLDSNLQIVSYSKERIPSDNNEARRYYTKLSKDTNFVCFLIDPKGMINYFIEGQEYGNGIFYTNEAYKSYEERKTIDQIEDVLEDYRQTLTIRNTYVKFFVPKSQLMSLRQSLKCSLPKKQFIKEYKHLLRNKPENCLRDDLMDYLSKNMRAHVDVEKQLLNQRRLDIALLDEKGNDLYFIEVKWVGQSIHADGNKVGTTYKAKPNINPDAVLQVMDYIQELSEKKEVIKVGYLVVFDARKEDFPDTGEGLTEDIIPSNQRKYFPNFKKVSDFRLKNESPQ